MALYTILLFSISWSAALHQGFGFPVVDQSNTRDSKPTHRVRIKRCSCNNQLDLECHYFCHLDIVWVNTPSKTTVYGLGSPLARRRRSTDRCLCSISADRTCNRFCVHSTENAAANMKTPSQRVRKHPDLQPGLESLVNAGPVIIIQSSEDRADFKKFLRSLMRAKLMAKKKDAAHTKPRGSRAQRLGYR
ncbi:endothelin-2 [Hoplias malabaricus]|uniref:endothelin-2 n=1 Tax=Hoplias malabaricus TaxID=27720 RepID=UPI0034628A79